MIMEFAGRIMGIIVDSVSDVVMLSNDDIHPKPTFSSSINTEFLKGMGKRDEKFIVLLDINKVLADEEIMEVESAVRFHPG